MNDAAQRGRAAAGHPIPNPLAGGAVTVKVVGYTLLSAVLFSASTSIIHHVSSVLDPVEIAFSRTLFGLAVMLPWIWRRGLGVLRTDRIWLHALRAVVGAAMMVSWFYALSLIPLGEAVALSFTAPLFSMVAAVFLLDERVGVRRWAAAIVGFIGVLVILRPHPGNFEWGAILVLFCSAVIAINVVLVKMLSRTEQPGTIVAYLGLFMVPITLVPAYFVWQWPSAAQLIWLILLGSLATGSQLCRVRALTLVDASAVAPFDFVRLPIIALVAFLVFDEIPDGWMWLGSAIIFASTLYITYRDIRVARAQPRAPVTRATAPDG